MTVRAARRAAVAVAVAVAGVAGVGPISAAEPAGTVAAGWERWRVEAPAGVRVAPYANDGYRLRRLPGGVWEVEVTVGPLESRTPFRPPTGPVEGAVGELARRLTAGSESRYQAVSRVLAWIARHVRYELDRELEQSAPAVLARRTAFCTGTARLAVALLAEVGIRTREVPGWVLAEDGGRGELHRWIEVHFPDRGWVFSDPHTSHHFVPSRYLRLADDTLVAPIAGGRLLAREGGLEEVELASGVPAAVRVRSNGDARSRATLAVRWAGGRLDGGRAELEGEGRRYWERIGGRGVTFLGLEPGSYSLTLLAPDGRTAVERRLALHGVERRILHLGTLPAVGSGRGEERAAGEGPRAPGRW